MTNGEITKIAYEGAEYAKVEGASQDGDILLRTARDRSYATCGAYYKAVDNGRPYKHFVDDAGDKCGLHDSLNYFAIYRKVSAAPQVSAPFAEMLTTKVDAVESDVASLDKRVSALEGAKPLAVGDRVRALANGQFDGVNYGEIGQITEVDYPVDDGDPYDIFVECDDNYDFFRPQDLELVAEDKPRKPVVGDIVVITGNTNGSRNAVGDIGKAGVSHSYLSATVDVLGKVSGNGNNTLYSEMRLATDAEKAEYAQAAKDAVFTKAGRNPNEFRKGDVVRIKEERHTMSRNQPGDIGEITGLNSNGCFVDVPGRNVSGAPGNHHVKGNLEIVCFAEDRKDVVAKGGR